MNIVSLGLSASASAEDINQLFGEHFSGDKSVDFLAVHYRSGALTEQMRGAIATLCDATHLATSCQGIMTHNGHDEIGLFAISDPDGDYGTACAPIGGNTYAAAVNAVEEALSNANRSGEAPDLIWISVTAGEEEEAIRGISDIFGPGIPVIGGTAADDAIEGNWAVSCGGREISSGVVVSVLFCSTPVSFAYQNGYEPTKQTGKVTKARARTIYEIDHQPAAAVYHKWTDGNLPISSPSVDRNILSEATFWPLGRETTTLGEVPYFLLAHPHKVNPDGSIDLFAEIETDEVLTQMIGDESALVDRAGRVAEFALKSGEMRPEDVAGSLMVYCAGCMLAVQDRLPEVVDGINTSLDYAPFLGVFTFGEQGPIHGIGNKHGNLMISSIVSASS